MKIKLLFFIFALSSILFAQVQQQTKYSVDDVMKKLEAIDNSLNEKVNSLRSEFDQKLNQSVNQIRDELSSKIEKLDSKVATISNGTEQVLKKISNVEAQNRGLRERISNVEKVMASVDGNINAVRKSTDEINSGIKEVSAKVNENSAKFDAVLSKIASNRTALVLGFVIVIILSTIVAVGVFNLSKLTKSVEKNILDSFEGTAGKIEVTTNDLKTLADVLKQQTSEIVAYQRILEERIIAAQGQIEAKIEEKLAARRRTQRKSSSPEE